MEDMSAFLSGSPGSHPHSDRPNWQPGDDDADELLVQKIADALRNGASERQMAKLLGLPRSRVWRLKLMAEIPEALRDRLGEAWRADERVRLSTKSWAAIGWALKHGKLPHDEIECCPNCGYRLRTRWAIPPPALKIVVEWCKEQEARES